jgi:hypothetical protein
MKHFEVIYYLIKEKPAKFDNKNSSMHSQQMSHNQSRGSQFDEEPHCNKKYEDYMCEKENEFLREENTNLKKLLEREKVNKKFIQAKTYNLENELERGTMGKDNLREIEKLRQYLNF